MIEEVGNVVLIGTAHVSPTSVATVERVILERRPKRVLVELDAARLKALRDPEAWRNTDILQVLKQRKQHLFLIQLYLASMQARMGRETGVSPGAELLRAVSAAEEVGAQVVLIDREVGITMKRGFGSMGFFARLKLFWHLWVQLLSPPPTEPVDTKAEVERLLETDALTQMTEEFAKVAPTVKAALIDERDAVMASHIQEHRGADTVVAVVGAGHMVGIKAHLANPAGIPDRQALLQPPPRRFPWALVIGFAIPIAIAIWLGLLVSKGDYAAAKDFLLFWVVSHFALAGLGAALARGHPLAVLTGAVVAPITSMLPIGIRSGWVAGYVQAKLRTPKVKDFEAVRTLETVREFWGNGIVKVLTVTSLTILGSHTAKIICLFVLARGGL